MPRYNSIADIIHDLEAESTALGSPRSLPTTLPSVEELWQAVQSRRSEGRYDEAAMLCQHLLRFCPDHVPASIMAAELQVARSKAQALCNEIETGLGAGNVVELMGLAHKAEAVYPGCLANTPAKSQLDSRFDRYCDYLRWGDEARKRGDLPEAIWYLERAQKYNPGEQDLTDVISLLRDLQERRSRRLSNGPGNDTYLALTSLSPVRYTVMHGDPSVSCSSKGSRLNSNTQSNGGCWVLSPQPPPSNYANEENSERYVSARGLQLALTILFVLAVAAFAAWSILFS